MSRSPADELAAAAAVYGTASPEAREAVERAERLARDREMMAPSTAYEQGKMSESWPEGLGDSYVHPSGGRSGSVGEPPPEPTHPDERGKAVGRIAVWCAELHAQRVYSAHMDASLAGGRFEPAPEPDFRARAERLLDEEIYRAAADAVEARLREQLEGMR